MTYSQNRKPLYLTYDGLTDPLGQSQILPYIYGLQQRGYFFTIISAEKPKFFQQSSPRLHEVLHQNTIQWLPSTYHKFPPVLSTLWDLWKMYKKASGEIRTGKYGVVHARSYLPGIIAMNLKKSYRLPWIFDMRGFWADERVEGGLWNLKNPFFKLVYQYIKKQETKMLKDADHIVVLTTKAKKIIVQKFGVDSSKVTVIPCCVDLTHFSPIKPISQKQDLLYLGSLGTWYMLDEMLDFFKLYKSSFPAARFRIVTKDTINILKQLCQKKNIPFEWIEVQSLTREQVPRAIATCAHAIYFIKPGYSKLASSATKLGEILAMGIPVVSNSQIGDQEELFEKYSMGVLVNDFNKEEYSKAISILKTQFFDPTQLRVSAESYFSLENGLNSYQAVYEQLS